MHDSLPVPSRSVINPSRSCLILSLILPDSLPIPFLIPFLSCPTPSLSCRIHPLSCPTPSPYFLSSLSYSFPVPPILLYSLPILPYAMPIPPLSCSVPSLFPPYPAAFHPYSLPTPCLSCPVPSLSLSPLYPDLFLPIISHSLRILLYSRPIMHDSLPAPSLSFLHPSRSCLILSLILPDSLPIPLLIPFLSDPVLFRSPDPVIR